MGNVSVDDVPDPRVTDSADAIVRITTSAICGIGLHFVRDTMPGMRPGIVPGHEAVGVVEETGPQVRNFNVGDRVLRRPADHRAVRRAAGRIRPRPVLFARMQGAGGC